MRLLILKLRKSVYRRFFVLLALSALLQHAALAQGKNVPPVRKATTQDSRAGQQAFAANCASCHGLDGKGGERAPDIVTRPQIRELSDSAIMSILEKGVPNTPMPAFRFLSVATRRSVVAHLRTLQGTSTQAALPGDVARGKELFFGKAGCATCHMVQGQGGFFASELTNYARGRAPEAIRSAIVWPNRDLDPRRRTVVVRLRSGESLEGIVRNEDNFSLQVLTPDGKLHLLYKSSLAGLTYRDESPMPSDYGTLLSSSELDDLVKFLASTAGMKPTEKITEELDED